MKFFLLVLGLAIPFWVVGSFIDIELLPGVPLSSLMVLGPALAALSLARKEDGPGGMIRLARRGLDLSRMGWSVWYGPVLLLMRGIAAAAYVSMRMLGSELPSPQVFWPAVPGMLIAVLLAAWAEELGWSGYATDRLQRHSSALQTGVVLGLFRAFWHVVPLVQAGRSFEWTTWQGVNLVRGAREPSRGPGGRHRKRSDKGGLLEWRGWTASSQGQFIDGS